MKNKILLALIAVLMVMGFKSPVSAQTSSDPRRVVYYNGESVKIKFTKLTNFELVCSAWGIWATYNSDNQNSVGMWRVCAPGGVAIVDSLYGIIAKPVTTMFPSNNTDMNAEEGIILLHIPVGSVTWFSSITSSEKKVEVRQFQEGVAFDIPLYGVIKGHFLVSKELNTTTINVIAFTGKNIIVDKETQVVCFEICSVVDFQSTNDKGIATYYSNTNFHPFIEPGNPGFDYSFKGIVTGSICSSDDFLRKLPMSSRHSNIVWADNLESVALGGGVGASSWSQAAFNLKSSVMGHSFLDSNLANLYSTKSENEILALFKCQGDLTDPSSVTVF